MPPPLIRTELQSVLWSGTASQPAFKMRFVTQQGPGSYPWYFVSQLYLDPEAKRPIGEKLPTKGDPDGYGGTGVWTAKAAGIALNSDTDYYLAIVNTGPDPHYSRSNVLQVIHELPALVSGDFDGDGLAIVIRPPTGCTPNAYRVQVLVGDALAAEQLITGPVLPGLEAGTQCLQIALRDVPFAYAPGPATVSVAGVVVDETEATSRGPDQRTTFPTWKPSFTLSTCDSGKGTTTLEWSNVGGALGYELTVGDKTEQVHDTQFTLMTLPTAPAVVRAANALFLGPASDPYAFLTQPVVTDVSYDGTNVCAAWQSVPGATKYLVAVVANDELFAAESHPADARSASQKFVPANRELDYSVVVQAWRGSDLGPPSEPVPVLPNALYVSPAVTAPVPFIYHAATLQYAPPWSATPPDIQLDFPNPWVFFSKLPTSAVTVGPFSLAVSKDGMSCTVSFGARVWTFDGTRIRQDLKQDYVAFLKATETANVTPNGLQLLQRIIARAMPQTFDETLYYGFGLDLDGGFVDLRPGMVLRVAAAEYTDVGDAGDTPSDQWYDGWAPGPIVDWEVVSYQVAPSLRNTGPDAFIAQLVSGGALQVAPPPSQSGTGTGAEGGVANAADLYFEALRQPFLRLFVPTKLQSASSIGTTTPVTNFTLGGASSFAALDKMDGSSSDVAYFRGRAVVTAAIRVTINSTEQVVPVGTTVRDVLDRYDARPQTIDTQLTGVSLERTVGAIGGTTVATELVRLDWSTLHVYPDGRSAIDLPLLAGDRLTVA